MIRNWMLLGQRAARTHRDAGRTQVQTQRLLGIAGREAELGGNIGHLQIGPARERCQFVQSAEHIEVSADDHALARGDQLIELCELALTCLVTQGAVHQEQGTIGCDIDVVDQALHA